MAKILVVDDSTVILEVLGTLLREEGYEVRTTQTVSEAMEIAQGWRPNLVLAEVFIRGEAGLGLVRQLRSEPSLADLPIIATSGFPEVERKALDQGATKFLAKPLEFDHLISTIGELLAGRRVSDEAEARAGARRAQQLSDLHAAATSAAQVVRRNPPALARLERGTRWLGRYFGGAQVTVYLQDDENLRACATSVTGSESDPAQASGLSAIASRVAESRSSLLISDLSSQARVLPLDLGAARLLASVPILVAGVPAGAICLVANSPLHFTAVDLSLLEQLGRKVASGLLEQPEGSFFASSGLISRTSYASLLQYELVRLRENDGELRLWFFRTAEPLEDCAGLFDGLASPRTAAGELGRHRLIVSNARRAHRMLESMILEKVREQLEIEAQASLILSATGLPMDEEALLVWGEALLSRADSAHPSISVDCRSFFPEPEHAY